MNIILLCTHNNFTPCLFQSSLETASLQWADYNTSYSQVSQWISDREAKLQKVAEPKPQRGGRKRHPTPGKS